MEIDFAAFAANDRAEAEFIDGLAAWADNDDEPGKAAQLRVQADQERADAEGWDAFAAAAAGE